MKLQKVWYRSSWFLLLLYFDRITKGMASAYCTLYSVKPAPFLTLRTCFNKGISWGWFYSDSMLNHWVLVLLSLSVLVLIGKYTYDRGKYGYAVLGETLILTGGIGNFIDRVAYGGVRDFIVFHYSYWTFPAFNFADVYITIGACIIVYNIIMHYEDYV